MQSLKIIITALVVGSIVYVGSQLQNPSELNVKASAIVCLSICILLAFIAGSQSKHDHIKLH